MWPISARQQGPRQVARGRVSSPPTATTACPGLKTCCQGLHTRRARSPLRGRHRLHRHRWGLTGIGVHDQPVQPPGGGLAHAVAPADQPGGGRTAHGLVQALSGTRVDLPLGPGQPIPQPRIPGRACQLRHAQIGESQGQLLGQGTHRKLVGQPESGPTRARNLPPSARPWTRASAG